MANWDIVTAYDADDAAWLRRQGHPHPAVRPGNEMPSTAEMKWALEAHENLELDYPPSDEDLYAKDEDGKGLVLRGFDWDEDRLTPGEYFCVRGGVAVLSVLIKLCERCGQLYLYPDSGAPSIVLGPSLDAQAVWDLYQEAADQEDSWAWFFEHTYGPDGLASDELG